MLNAMEWDIHAKIRGFIELTWGRQLLDNSLQLYNNASEQVPGEVFDRRVRECETWGGPADDQHVFRSLVKVDFHSCGASGRDVTACTARIRTLLSRIVSGSGEITGTLETVLHAPIRFQSVSVV